MRRRRELMEVRRQQREAKLGPAERVLGARAAGEVSPVAAAVEPTRGVAIERAREFARSLAQRSLEIFAEDPAAANRPSMAGYARGNYDAVEYAQKKLLHERIMSLTSRVPGTDRRVPDSSKVEAFVQAAGETANMQFTAFVQKLELKVGDCTDATLSGEDVWGYSILTVTKPNGLKEKWKTQQIINISKLGRPFNQWPTRKVR